MGVRELSDKGPDGSRLGQSVSDLVSFHGVNPVDQAATVSLASGATIATTVSAVQKIVVALAEKGLMASA